MQTSLSIIIPVYNEERKIADTLLSLLEFLKYHRLEAEIIMVDDGSTDRTLWIAERFIKLIKIIPVYPNKGKGFAIKTGVTAASGDLVLFMDADLATPLTEIPKILKKIINENADIVIGSRGLVRNQVKRTLFRSIAGKIFVLISHLLIPLPHKDTQCGFKIFRREVAKEIFNRAKISRWAFDMEILFLARKMGLKVLEMPVVWREMAGSKVRMFRDAILMTKDLLAIRFFDLSRKYDLDDFHIIERNYDVLRETGSEIKEL